MISVVVPAHNEEEVIEATLRGLVQNIKSEREIIVVADHCKDKTEQIVKQFSLSHPEVKLIRNERAGCFGNALRAGFEAARGDAVVPIMADLCDDPTTIDRLHAKLNEGYDMVCGSRYMKGGKKSGGPIIQNIASRVVSFSLRIFSGIPTWDVANSLKMYRRPFLEQIGYGIEKAGTEFSMRLAFKAYFAGGKITEIPTTWKGEDIPLGDEFKILKRTPGYLSAYLAALYKKILIKPSDFIAIVFIGVTSLIILFPLLFQGMILSEGERISGYYPWAISYSQAIHAGHSILWNPYYFGGFPTFLNQFIGSLYPIHFILFYLLPALLAFHISILIALFGGMLFAYLFGRANSFSIVGSLILSLTYTIGQTFGLFTTGISYSESFFVLPLLLFALLRARNASSILAYLLWSILGGVAIGIGFLAGFAQTFLYGLIFAFCYALYLDLSNRPRFRLRSFRAFGSMMGAGVIGVLVGSPQLLAVLSFLPYSVRTLDYTANEGSLRVFDLVTFTVPYYIHVPHLMTGVAGVYFGGIAFALFLYALVFARTKQVWFFAASYFTILAFSYHLPIFSLVNDHGPFLSRLGAVTRWLFIGAFPFAYIAASGYEHLSNVDNVFLASKKFARFLWGIAVVLYGTTISLLLASAGLLYLLLHQSVRDKLLNVLLKGKSLSFPLSHYQSVFEENIKESYHPISLSSFIFLAFILITVLTPLVFFHFRKKRNIRIFAIGCFVLVALNFFIALVAEDQGAFISKKDFLGTSPPVAQAILSRETNLQSFRILPLLLPEGFFRDIYGKQDLSQDDIAIINRDFLMSDVGTYYGLQNMFGFEPLRALRQNQVLNTLLDPNVSYIFDRDAVVKGARIDQHVNDAALKLVSIDEKTKSISKLLNLISMMNVKYLISYYPLTSSNLVPIMIASSTEDVQEYLYENTSVMPRMYFAKEPILWKGTARDLLVALSDPQDFNKNTFIECATCTASTQGPSSATFSEYSNGYAKIRAVTQNGGWLVLSDSYLPGWKAEIDGKTVPIYAANYLFQAVNVPPGMHTVTFTYEDVSWNVFSNAISLGHVFFHSF